MYLKKKTHELYNTIAALTPEIEAKDCSSCQTAHLPTAGCSAGRAAGTIFSLKLSISRVRVALAKHKHSISFQFSFTT